MPLSTPGDWDPGTLRDHLLAMAAEADRRYQQRFESQEKAVKDALVAVEAMRHELELRHEQRFLAQERAVEVALDGVTREFHEHLVQYQQETKAAQHTAEKAVSAALAATEKAIDKQERATELAITKQETATEKRFEGVNEFRAQQADIITTFARKAEVDARLASLSDKLETAMAQVNANVSAQERRTADSFASIGSRLDILKGSSQGSVAMWGYVAGAVFLIIAVVTFMNTR